MPRLLPTPRCRENPVGKFKALIGKAFRRPFSDTRVSKNASRVGKPRHAVHPPAATRPLILQRSYPAGAPVDRRRSVRFPDGRPEGLAGKEARACGFVWQVLPDMGGSLHGIIARTTKGCELPMQCLPLF